MLDSARLSYGEYRDIRRKLFRRGSADRRWLFARLLPIRRHRVELREALSPDVWSEFDEPASPLQWMDEYGWQSRPVPPAERPPLLALAHRQYDSFYPAFVEDWRQTSCLKYAKWDIGSILREARVPFRTPAIMRWITSSAPWRVPQRT